VDDDDVQVTARSLAIFAIRSWLTRDSLERRIILFTSYRAVDRRALTDRIIWRPDIGRRVFTSARVYRGKSFINCGYRTYYYSRDKVIAVIMKRMYD